MAYLRLIQISFTKLVAMVNRTPNIRAISVIAQRRAVNRLIHVLRQPFSCQWYPTDNNNNKASSSRLMKQIWVINPKKISIWTVTSHARGKISRGTIVVSRDCLTFRFLNLLFASVVLIFFVRINCFTFSGSHKFILPQINGRAPDSVTLARCICIS